MKEERVRLSTGTEDRESSTKPRNVGSLLGKSKEIDSHLNSAKGTALKNYFELLTIKIDACAVTHYKSKRHPYNSQILFCIYIFLHFPLQFTFIAFPL